MLFGIYSPSKKKKNNKIRKHSKQAWAKDLQPTWAKGRILCVCFFFLEWKGGWDGCAQGAIQTGRPAAVYLSDSKWFLIAQLKESPSRLNSSHCPRLNCRWRGSIGDRRLGIGCWLLAAGCWGLGRFLATGATSSHTQYSCESWVSWVRLYTEKEQ